MLAGVLSRLRLQVALGAAAGAAGLYLAAPRSSRTAEAPPAAGLSPDEWRAFRLVSREPLTTGTPAPTFLYRFALDDAQQAAGLGVASCMLTRAPIGSAKPDGSRAFVLRPYTPISAPDQRGHFDLAVKVYPGGKMSRHIDSLRPGDVLECKGPIPKISIEEVAKHGHVGMVAGGTGLTPMLQVAEEVLRRGLPVRLSLVYASVSEADIVLRDRLEALAAVHPRSFQLHLLLDESPAGGAWRGGVGYVTRGLLERHMPAPGSGGLVLVCGPPPMMAAVSGSKAQDKSQGELAGLLRELGYAQQEVYKF